MSGHLCLWCPHKHRADNQHGQQTKPHPSNAAVGIDASLPPQHPQAVHEARGAGVEAVLVARHAELGGPAVGPLAGPGVEVCAMLAAAYHEQQQWETFWGVLFYFMKLVGEKNLININQVINIT